jgi:hypothetical protein
VRQGGSIRFLLLLDKKATIIGLWVFRVYHKPKVAGGRGKVRDGDEIFWHDPTVTRKHCQRLFLSNARLTRNKTASPRGIGQR